MRGLGLLRLMDDTGSGAAAGVIRAGGWREQWLAEGFDRTTWYRRRRQDPERAQ
jgi:hypothetical protein